MQLERGDCVIVNALSIARGLGYRDRYGQIKIGDVVSFTRGGSPKIVWRGNTTPSIIHPDFLETVPPGTDE